MFIISIHGEQFSTVARTCYAGFFFEIRVLWFWWGSGEDEIGGVDHRRVAICISTMGIEEAVVMSRERVGSLGRNCDYVFKKWDRREKICIFKKRSVILCGGKDMALS